MPELHSPNNRNALSTPANTPHSSATPTRRSIRDSAGKPVSRDRFAEKPGQAIAAYVPTKPVKKQMPGQKRAVALLTILVVPGFIATTSIPAFALGNQTVETVEYADSTVAQEDEQTVVAETIIGDVQVKRGAFDATTQAELDAKKAAAAITAARNGQYSTVGPRAAGDDYPWRSSSGLSPLRYVARQCTDFVAWRINRDAGSTSAPWKWDWGNMTPGGGSASAWAGAWKRNGWKTSNTPVRGAVAWFSGNHVAYVKSVDGKNVNLEEYNWNGSGAYHTRTISSSDVALFLYPPP